MRIRSTIPRLLLAAVCGGALLSAPLITAPPAAAACAAGTVLDSRTGICWDATSTGSNVISGTGGVCMPGRLGLCLAGLQNSQMPGANLPTQTGAGANRADTWP